MGQKVWVASAAMQGPEHYRRRTNRQDQVFQFRYGKWIFGAVADGCSGSSQNKSEAGAADLVHAAVQIMWMLIDRKVSMTTFQRCFEEEMTAFLLRKIAAFPFGASFLNSQRDGGRSDIGNPGNNLLYQYIADTLNATLLATCIHEDHGGFVFVKGDGAVYLDGELHTFDYNDAPPYWSYLFATKGQEYRGNPADLISQCLIIPPGFHRLALTTDGWPWAEPSAFPFGKWRPSSFERWLRDTNHKRREEQKEELTLETGWQVYNPDELSNLMRFLVKNSIREGEAKAFFHDDIGALIIEREIFEEGEKNEFMKTVRIGNERVYLSSLLGQGAMADIYEADVGGHKKAAKIYRYDGDPEKEKMRPVRATKIPHMIGMHLPQEILPPQEVILDDTTKEFIGFTMELLPKGYTPLAELYSRTFWAKHLITPTKALTILKGLHGFTERVHGKGLVIGDFNPGNALFHVSKLGQILGCDVDSYQIPGFNGREIHHAYGAPRLYGQNLANGGVAFLPEDDWWSYHVHFLTGLTRGAHPFRGNGTWWHQHVAKMEVPDRVLAGLSVFHPEVTVTGGSLPIQILSDEVLHYLQTVFVQHKRADGPMPSWVFDLVFRECPVCKTEFARPKCPVCHKQVFVPSIAPVLTVIYESDVYKAGAAIVVAAFVGNEVRLVLRKQNTFTFQRVALDGSLLASMPIALAIDPTEEYSMQIGEEYVCIADSSALYLFDLEGKLVEKTTTSSFMHKPMFALGDTLYRGAGAIIMKWSSVRGMRSYQPFVQNIAAGSTWLKATKAGLVFMSYVNGRYDWALQHGLIRLKIGVQPIPSGKHVVSQDVLADEASVAMLRTVEDRLGRMTTLVDIFDLATKQVKSKVGDEVMHHAAYMGGTLLYASDRGLVVWKDGQNPEVRKGTEQVVTAGDQIILANGGTILVIKGNGFGILRAKGH